jgi:GT2 family glycosyltransferase
VSHIGRFSIIIPTHNEGEWLERTVASILSTTDYPSHEIIIVADGCSDGSIRFLQTKQLEGIYLIELKNSLGCAKARNIGASMASGDYFVFVDSHVLPQDSCWLDELATQLQNASTGAASLKITVWGKPHLIGHVYTIANMMLEPGWAEPRCYDQVQRVPAISGACFAVRREVFEATGGFDAGLRKWGREDTEFSLRLWRLGYELSLSPRAGITHRFKFDKQGKPITNFAVHWGQLTYNTMRTALLHMPDPWVGRVVDCLAQNHKHALRAALKDLAGDEGFQARKKMMAERFVRCFEEYVEEFRDLLPIADCGPGLVRDDQRDCHRLGGTKGSGD